MRKPSTKPTTTKMPKPSEPVEVSTQGRSSTCGWPWNGEFSLRSFNDSRLSQKPYCAPTAYSAGAAWPLDSTKRSRRGSAMRDGATFNSTPYRQANKSTDDITPPGWPEPARKMLAMEYKHT